jgi:mannose-6-phosphate isomerase-like protein (cupin superfamily)
MLTEIKNAGEILAIIVGKGFDKPGIHFFTPGNFSQQLGYLHHPAGKVIPPHVHNHIVREVKQTLEVLFIKKGRVRVDFYSEEKKYLESVVLTTGDVILLASGGHGFEVLEPTEMIEVKQGPYAGELDKTRFSSELKEIKLVDLA